MSYTNYDFPHTHFYESDLRELIAKCESYDKTINKLNQWIEENDPKIEDFYELYMMLINGNLPEGVQEGINKWMEENALDIVGQLVKMVFFGLTMDGYFIAYIPDSWNDITFGTSGLDDFPPDTDFGHLTLSY